MLRIVTWMLALLGGACAFSAARTVRADDPTTEQWGYQIRAYPMSEAELEKWVSRYMIPGKTRPQDVAAIFGRRVGTHHGDYYIVSYQLHALGVSGCNSECAELAFLFDDHSGTLHSADIYDAEERQTGFHVEASSGQ